VSEILSMILEKTLKELIADYKACAGKVALAQLVAAGSEKYLRAFIPVAVRDGGFSAEKILADCGLNVLPDLTDTESGV